MTTDLSNFDNCWSDAHFASFLFYYCCKLDETLFKRIFMQQRLNQTSSKVWQDRRGLLADGLSGAGGDAQWFQIVKTGHKLDSTNSWYWWIIFVLATIWQVLNVNRKRKLCEFAENCIEKLVKQLWANLFSVGFSRLEPLCDAAVVAIELASEKKVFFLCPRSVVVEEENWTRASLTLKAFKDLLGVSLIIGYMQGDCREETRRAY
jgi:hypothetical protein